MSRDAVATMKDLHGAGHAFLIYLVKRHGEIMLTGTGYPDPRNQCAPQGVPYVFTSGGMQLLQQPDKITILYDYDHQVRHIRINQSHPAQVTPSWYGDSIGHYEARESFF